MRDGSGSPPERGTIDHSFSDPSASIGGLANSGAITRLRAVAFF
jgi:hypothetical protein